MLDPNALGTAFDIHWQLVHSVTFIEHFSGPQGRRRCLAAGVLDIWHGTDHQGTARKYLARHGSTRSGHGTARDVPACGATLDIAIISTPMGCKGGWIQGARRVAKGGKNLWKKMPVLCQEYMLFFCLPLSNQPRLDLLSTQKNKGGAGGYSMYSWQRTGIYF